MKGLGSLGSWQRQSSRELEKERHRQTRINLAGEGGGGENRDF